ncbi:hypothetical protein [Clostridium beijerinckii]|uniref:Phage-related protein n=1 Tax=Clostridium beijerinckii TaxID=1520 RepID=A0AAX0B3R0_CLOBE|nr:hypothetical protein [Clostridium beijerinckii]NRT90020.1 phage-related protein [Clostridium beijerinckii]NYC69551.1 phage-related protein [Clostridium beijerinckii]
MIRLFDKNETNFEHNMWVLSECKSAIVTESVDGIFDLDLVYTLNDRKQLSQYLVIGNIIKCPISETDTRGEQLFRIRTRKPNTRNNEVTIYAQAIARADLMKDFILGVEVPAGKNRKEAVGIILSNCVEHKDYHVGNLDTNTNTSINLGLEEETGKIINYLDVSYVSPLEGLLGNSQSVQAAYGGEIIYNNKEINFVDERGSDNTFEISSNKNLQELEQEISDLDLDNFATALIMCSNDGVYLPNNEIIYSPNAATLGKYYKKIVCDDVSLVDDTQEALNIVYDQLRERAQKKFNEGIDKLPINNTINFILLKNTEEYKNISMLEKCELGNSVNINYYKANITATGRVTKIKYNALANDGEGKIAEIEIGNKKTNIAKTISSISTKANTANTKSDKNTKDIKKVKKDSKEFQVTMEERADSIELSVTNLKEDTEASIEVLGDKIQSKVSKGEFGSYIEQNYDSVVEAIQDATGSHTCTFDAGGLTVQNGGFKIKNASGVIVLWLGDDGYVKLKDLQLDDTALEKGSYFYYSLMNMEKVLLKSLEVLSEFSIGDSKFKISMGESEYTFTGAVKHILKDQGLI